MAEEKAFDPDDFATFDEIEITKIESTEARKPFGELEKKATQMPNINWQPLSHATIDQAKQTRMPILLVACHPSLTSSEIFDFFDQDEDIVEQLTENYIPAVTDVSFSPEYFAEVNLSSIHSGSERTDFPLMVILTPNGLPLMMKGIPEAELSDRASSLGNMLSNVSLDWHERINFYEADSLRMINQRLKRNTELFLSADTRWDEEQLTQMTYRELYILGESELEANSFQSSSPFSALHSFFAAFNNPLLPKSLRDQVRDLTIKLAPRAAFGMLYVPSLGLYADHSLASEFEFVRPNFSLRTQTEAIEFLSMIAATTGDSTLTQQAIQVNKNIDSYFRLNQEHYSALLYSSLPPEQRMPNLFIDDSALASPLSTDEIQLLRTAFHITPDGNLPLGLGITDHFKSKNSVQRIRDLEAVQKLTGKNEIETRQAIATALGKLNPLIREQVQLTTQSPGTLDASVDRIRANLAIYSLDQDESRLANSAMNARRLIKTFAATDAVDSFALTRVPGGTQANSPAQAYDYIKLADLFLQLHSISGEPEFLQQATSLENLISERLDQGDYVLETPKGSQPMATSSFGILEAGIESTQALLANHRRRLDGALEEDKRAEKIDNFLSQIRSRFIENLQLGARIRRLSHQYKQTLVFADTPPKAWQPALASAWIQGFIIQHNRPDFVNNSFNNPSDSIASTPAVAMLVRPNGKKIAISSLPELQKLLNLAKATPPR